MAGAKGSESGDGFWGTKLKTIRIDLANNRFRQSKRFFSHTHLGKKGGETKVDARPHF